MSKKPEDLLLHSIKDLDNCIQDKPSLTLKEKEAYIYFGDSHCSCESYYGYHCTRCNTIGQGKYSKEMDKLNEYKLFEGYELTDYGYQVMSQLVNHDPNPYCPAGWRSHGVN